eukprot:gb/GECH01000739.1/.p1 GENE.gb/GECH01000739.1/~~gb/GECH01000739.1/.p1  ORF type:complete len:348 (+),score=26.14 gb/GECH01000739.1/:1-1044(+)
MVHEDNEKISFKGPDMVCGCLYNRYVVVHGDLQNRTHVLDLETMKWLKKNKFSSDRSPSYREASSSAVYNDTLYLFAGYAETHYLDTLHRLSLKNITDTSYTVSWQRIHYKRDGHGYRSSGDDHHHDGDDAQDTTPSTNWCLSRWLHTICVVDSSLILFGGYWHRDLNDLWLMRLDDNHPTFRQIHIQGSKPCPRGGHKAEVIGRDMFVFGGYGNASMLDDLWAFNLDRCSWRPVLYESSPSPLSCKLPFFGALNDQYMVVIGGERFSSVDGASNSFLFDFETRRWQTLKTIDKFPDSFLSGCVHGTKVYMFYENRMRIIDMGSKMSHFRHDTILLFDVPLAFSKNL